RTEPRIEQREGSREGNHLIFDLLAEDSVLQDFVRKHFCFFERCGAIKINEPRVDVRPMFVGLRIDLGEEDRLSGGRDFLEDDECYEQFAKASQGPAQCALRQPVNHRGTLPGTVGGLKSGLNVIYAPDYV